MTLLINAGSRFDQTLPNTYEQAEIYARSFHFIMATEGIDDVDLELPGKPLTDGRWQFTFRHRVTDVKVNLETAGVPEDVEREYCPFGIRWYWDGGSYCEPRIEHFLPEGWVARKRYEIVPPVHSASYDGPEGP